MNNNFAFQNVNLFSMNFANNKNDIEFQFIDSLGNSGKYCGKLLCTDFLSLKINTDFDDDDQLLPQFVCDVSIEKSAVLKGGYLVSFLGSSYDIVIVCKGTKIFYSAADELMI